MCFYVYTLKCRLQIIYNGIFCSGIMKYNRTMQREGAQIPYLLFELVVCITPDYTFIQNYAASTKTKFFLNKFLVPEDLFVYFCFPLASLIDLRILSSFYLICHPSWYYQINGYYVMSGITCSILWTMINVVSSKCDNVS